MIEPIRRSITVHRAPEEAFRLFTTEMGTWWPLANYKIGKRRGTFLKRVRQGTLSTSHNRGTIRVCRSSVAGDP